MITEGLTQRDMEMLQQEKRLGRTILLMGIFVGIGLAVLMGLLFPPEERRWWLSFLIAAVVVLSAAYFSWKINHLYNQDIEEGVKECYGKPVEKIEKELWCNIKMISLPSDKRTRQKFFTDEDGNYAQSDHADEEYVLYAGNLQYPIGWEEYQMLKDEKEVAIYYAPHSRLFLGVGRMK